MFVKRGVGVRFDHLGLPVDDSSESFGTAEPAILHMGDLDSVRALVVLGEPGLGKSSMLEHWAQCRREAGVPDDAICEQQLGEIGSHDILRSDVFEPVASYLSADADAHANLYLDSFDQGLVALPHLAQFLKNELRRLDPARVSLRLTSRVARWDNGLESTLRELWGEEHFRVCELLPLSEPEVRRALQRWGVPAESFMQALGERRIGPLAGNLITLQFLVSHWRERGSLPANRLAAYEQGCRHLVADRREDPAGNRQLEDGDRLVLAARCAAAAMLAAKPEIFLGPSADRPRTKPLLRLEELQEGEECWVSAAPRAPSERELRYALESAIFSARADRTVGIAHQSYAEYLTAWYLRHRRFDERRLVNLLTVPTGAAGKRIAPQLAEVACWLAWLDEPFRRWLLAEDLEIVLKSDMPISEDAREEVLGRVLDALDKGRLRETYRADVVREYRRFCHPGLAHQLRPWISAAPSSARTFGFVTRVAVRCEVGDLVPDLLGIALDRAANHDRRVEAGRAVAAIGGADDKRRLAELVDCSAADDLDDELRAIGLECGWPGSLSIERVLAAAMVRAGPNFIGSFHRFWRDGRWAEHLGPAELVRALQWLPSGNLHTDEEDVFWSVRSVLWAKAIEQAASEPVRAAFAKAASVPLLDYHQFVIRRQADMPGGAPEISDELRLDLAVRMLQTDAESRRTVPRSYELLHTLHIPSLLERLRGTADAALRSGLAACIARLTLDAWNDSDWARMDAAFQVAETESVLEGALQRYFGSVDLMSPQAQAMREEYETLRQLDAPALSPPKIPAQRQLGAALDRCEAGQTEAFQGVIQALARGVNSQGWPRTDLHASTLWVDLESSLQDRILAAALKYLHDQPTPPAKEATNNLTSSEVTPAAAIALLFHARPNLLTGDVGACLERWVPAVFLQLPRGGGIEDDRKLLAFLVERFPGVVHQALVDRLSLEARDSGLVPKAMDWISLSRCSVLWAAAFEIAAHGSTQKMLAGDIVRRGVDHGCRERAAEICEGWLADGTLAPEFRCQAAHTLIRCKGAEGWCAVLGSLEKEEALCGAWADDMCRWTSDQALRMSLEPIMCESLFNRLERLFPSADAPSFTAEWTPGLAVEQTKCALLNLLRYTGTQEAVDVLSRLAVRWPDHLGIGADLLGAEAVLSEKLWTPVPPAQLMELARRGDARLIRNDAELAEAVLASLERLQGKLSPSIGGGPMAKPDLWDEACGRPKSEERLSDYVARHLMADLREGWALALREVEVRRRNPSGIGERLDVLVTLTPRTPAPSARSVPAGPLLLVIEVKGCWNPNLWTDPENQLKDGYLRKAGCRQGIYAVGYFGCERWHESDPRKQQSQRNAPGGLDEVRRRMKEECGRLTDADGVVRDFVLDVTY